MQFPFLYFGYHNHQFQFKTEDIFYQVRPLLKEALFFKFWAEIKFYLNLGLCNLNWQDQWVLEKFSCNSCETIISLKAEEGNETRADGYVIQDLVNL